MTDQCDKYYQYSRILKRVLLFSGLWPSARPSIFFRLVPLLHGLTAILTICAILNFCRYHIESLNLIFKGLGMALAFITIIQKMSCLFFYRGDLIKLHVSLDETFLQDLDDAELRPILLSPLLTIYRPSLIMSIICSMIMTMYLITPIILIAIQHSRGNHAPKYILPFPTLYPWGIETNGWLYRGHYMFEIYAGVCVTAVTISVDSLFGYYIFQICGQLRTLSYRMKNLSSRKNYRQPLNECISKHQILMRCQKYLERIYGPTVLWLSITNALSICGLIYQAANMNSTSAIIVVPLYTIFKTMQVLYYGWLGSSLTTENHTFREAIYASDWPGSDEKFFMTTILTMMNYNKSFVLKACSVLTISIDMFVAVSNTAISYYFMLRTLEESHNT